MSSPGAPSGPASPPPGATPTTWELRRFLVGELPAARRQEIEAALAGDEGLRMRAEAMKAEDAAFQAAMPFARFVADHEARVAATQGPLARLLAILRSARFIGGASALAAAAALLVATNLGAPPDPEDAIRTKGARAGVGIGYFVDEADRVRVGQPGDALTFGDRIQFAVRDPAEATAMVLVGVDGHGAVTVYAAEALPTTREKGAKARVLTQSVVLDEAVGPERFFVVYGAGSVAALRGDVETAARRLVEQRADLTAVEALPLATRDAQQSSVHIVKVRR